MNGFLGVHERGWVYVRGWRMCDMTHSHVWSASLVDMLYSYVDSFICDFVCMWESVTYKGINIGIEHVYERGTSHIWMRKVTYDVTYESWHTHQRCHIWVMAHTSTMSHMSHGTHINDVTYESWHTHQRLPRRAPAALSVRKERSLQLLWGGYDY